MIASSGQWLKHRPQAHALLAIHYGKGVGILRDGGFVQQQATVL
jgi:hypothetical protein